MCMPRLFIIKTPDFIKRMAGPYPGSPMECINDPLYYIHHPEQRVYSMMNEKHHYDEFWKNIGRKAMASEVSHNAINEMKNLSSWLSEDPLNSGTSKEIQDFLDRVYDAEKAYRIRCMLGQSVSMD